MEKIIKYGNRVISILLVTSLLIMSFIVISSKVSGGEPQAFGYKIKIVLSGSMEPTFKTGSIIAVSNVMDKKSLQKGDVITFIKDNQMITHRIVGISRTGSEVQYETKGDNNENKDGSLVSSHNVEAVYTGFTIPYVGYFIDFVRSPKGKAMLFIIPGIILLGASVLSTLYTVSELEKERGSSKKSIEKGV